MQTELLVLDARIASIKIVTKAAIKWTAKRLAVLAFMNFDAH